VVVDVFGLTLVKRFTYRGDSGEEWSNQYWLSAPIPTTSAEFKAQADALIGLETECYAPTSKVVAAYGYAQYETDPKAEYIGSVWAYDYALAGEESPGKLTSAAHPMAGDQVGLLSWQTDRKSAKSKPIWLRKFFHDGFVDLTNKDHIDNGTLAAYNEFGGALGLAPAFPGLGHVRSPVADAPILLSGGSINVTIHQLKRRGKRPLASTQSGSATSAATLS